MNIREIVFKTVTMRNFKSWGQVPTTFVIDNPGITLVIGENLDNTAEGKTSNGVGKTSSLEAICYALYDKTPSNISRDRLINNTNKANMEVVLEFEKGGCEYVIRRARKTKRGTYVKLEKDGKDLTLDSMSHTNDLIQEIIGLPFELFVQIVSISASSSIPFFNLPLRSGNGPSQVGMIEELFDLKTLTEKAEKLKYKIKDTKARLELQQQKFELLTKEVERHQRLVEQARKRVSDWEKDTAREITEIQSSLKKIENVDIDAQQVLYEQLTVAKQKLKSMKTQVQTLERDMETDEATVSRRSAELKHLQEDQCPFCLQSMPSAAEKAGEVLDKINALNGVIAVRKQAIEEVETKITDTTTEIQELESQLTVSNINELVRIRSSADTLRRKLEELEVAKNPHTDNLLDLESVEIEEPNKDELDELYDLYDHQKFLLKLLTKKDSFVRKNLLSKSIPYLNSRLSHNLKELGLNHVVEFTQELTASISQFGNSLDFGNLSHGQQARVNIALSFAFRDVLQKMHGKVNILILDEICDVGLDTVGIYAAVKMIKQVVAANNLSSWIISHKDEVTNMFDRHLKIYMKDGFSQLESD